MLRFYHFAIKNKWYSFSRLGYFLLIDHSVLIYLWTLSKYTSTDLNGHGQIWTFPQHKILRWLDNLFRTGVHSAVIKERRSDHLNVPTLFFWRRLQFRTASVSFGTVRPFCWKERMVFWAFKRCSDCSDAKNTVRTPFHFQ